MRNFMRVLFLGAAALVLSANQSQARWLDTQTGRWLERDPLGNHQIAIQLNTRRAVMVMPSMGDSPLGARICISP